MYSKNTSYLLVEIGIEELPVIQLNKLSKKFLYWIQYYLKKVYFVFYKIQLFFSLRRLSCLVSHINLDQKKISYIINNSILLTRNDYWITYISSSHHSFLSKKIIFNFIDINYIEYKDINIVYKHISNYITYHLPKIICNVLSMLIKNQKVMRWGLNNILFIKPISHIIILLDDMYLITSINTIMTSNYTYANKYLNFLCIQLKKAIYYEWFLLKYGKVIVNYKKRLQKIYSSLSSLINIYKYYISYNKLYLCNLALSVEYPLCLVCKFKKKYLLIPQDIIVFIMSTEFHYINVFTLNNKLTNYFIIVVDGYYVNKKHIIKGYENIINLILYDIYNLYVLDKKVKFITYIYKLKNIFYYPTLGSLYDKVKRMLFISNKIFFLLENRNIINLRILSHLILLCKCDLVTNLCKGYSKLKGIVGSCYLLLDELSSVVKNRFFIIQEYYYPRFNGDYIPTNIYSIILFLSDKIDTIVSIFVVHKNNNINYNSDPYALRRLSVLILQVLIHNRLSLNLFLLIKYILLKYTFFSVEKYNQLLFNICQFIFNRSLHIFLKLGYTKKVFLSINKKNNYDIWDIYQRIKALSLFMQISVDKFRSLIIVSKRISVILLKEQYLLNNYVFNIKYLILDVEKKLYYYNLILKRKYLMLIKQRLYNKLLFLFCLSRKIIHNFFLYVRLDIDNQNLKKNRLFLLFELYNFFFSFIKFSDYY